MRISDDPHLTPLRVCANCGGQYSTSASEASESELGDGSLNSSAYEVGVADERILPFKTAREVVEATPAETEWVVNGYVAKGGITEVDGKIKAAGKTTWISRMVREILEGKPFMNRETTRTGVVWLTEQTPASFKEVLERAGLTNSEDLIILGWHDVVNMKWPDVARAAADKAVKVGATMLVVDTIGQFAGMRGDWENSAGAALEAMKPLQQAAGRELAVVMLRHERKGGGEVGESGRGSSAIGGAVDIILSLRRPEGNSRDTVREIHALSRFDETPTKLVIELTEEGYVTWGDTTAFAETEAESVILKLLPSEEENALDTASIVTELDKQNVKRTVATSVLARLASSGIAERIGEGKKGNPYRYYKPTTFRRTPDQGEDTSDFSADSVRNTTMDNSASVKSVGRMHSSETPIHRADERKTDEYSHAYSSGNFGNSGLKGIDPVRIAEIEAALSEWQPKYPSLLSTDPAELGVGLHDSGRLPYEPLAGEVMEAIDRICGGSRRS